MNPINSASGGIRIFHSIQIFLFVLFFLVLLINCVSVYFDTKDLTQSIGMIGKAFYDPLNSISETIKSISSGESIGFFDSLGKYFNLYYNIYILYLYLWIISKIVNLFFGNVNSPIITILITISLFYFIMILFGVLILHDSINLPFAKTGEIFRGLINIISNPKFNPDIIPNNLNNSCSKPFCTL